MYTGGGPPLYSPLEKCECALKCMRFSPPRKTSLVLGFLNFANFTVRLAGGAGEDPEATDRDAASQHCQLHVVLARQGVQSGSGTFEIM